MNNGGYNKNYIVAQLRKKMPPKFEVIIKKGDNETITKFHNGREANRYAQDKRNAGYTAFCRRIEA